MLITVVLCENKYSKEANAKKETISKPSKKGIDFRTLDKPFRMNKLNILWTKAQQVKNNVLICSLYMVKLCLVFSYNFSIVFFPFLFI